MCTRIYRWHYHSLPNAIGTLQGRGRDGSNFLETAKMCGLSSAASLPAARCAGGSVFILRAKWYAGRKMENGGLWSKASLPATLGVPARHDRERRYHATAAHSRLPIAGCSQQAAHSSLGSHVTAGTHRTRPASTRPRQRAPSGVRLVWLKPWVGPFLVATSHERKRHFRCRVPSSVFVHSRVVGEIRAGNL